MLSDNRISRCLQSLHWQFILHPTMCKTSIIHKAGYYLNVYTFPKQNILACEEFVDYNVDCFVNNCWTPPPPIPTPMENSKLIFYMIGFALVIIALLSCMCAIYFRRRNRRGYVLVGEMTDPQLVGANSLENENFDPSAPFVPQPPHPPPTPPRTSAPTPPRSVTPEVLDSMALDEQFLQSGARGNRSCDQIKTDPSGVEQEARPTLTRLQRKHLEIERLNKERAFLDQQFIAKQDEKYK
jgi:hypothetical protein